MLFAAIAAGSFNKYKSSERLRTINHKLVQQQWRPQQSLRQHVCTYVRVSCTSHATVSAHCETIKRKSK